MVIFFLLCSALKTFPLRIFWLYSIIISATLGYEPQLVSEYAGESIDNTCLKEKLSKGVILSQEIAF